MNIIFRYNINQIINPGPFQKMLFAIKNIEDFSSVKKIGNGFEELIIDSKQLHLFASILDINVVDHIINLAIEQVIDSKEKELDVYGKVYSAVLMNSIYFKAEEDVTSSKIPEYFPNSTQLVNSISERVDFQNYVQHISFLEGGISIGRMNGITAFDQELLLACFEYSKNSSFKIMTDIDYLVLKQEHEIDQDHP